MAYTPTTETLYNLILGAAILAKDKPSLTGDIADYLGELLEDRTNLEDFENYATPEAIAYSNILPYLEDRKLV